MKKKIGAILLAGFTVFGLTACSQSWERTKKDMESEYGGGLQRTIHVISESGQEIATYEGKFDIEKKNGRLKFVDENKKVHLIYLGNSCTVIVDEN